MKKVIYAGAFLALVGVSVVACKKEQVVPGQNREIEYRLDNIPIIKFQGNQESAVKNEDDADEEKLNGQLLDLANATKDLIKNQTFNALLVQIARESNVETVYYSEIKSVSPDFYNQINQKLAEKSLSIEGITANMTHQPILPNPEFPETGELEIYEPAILVPNASIANANLQSLISPNIETLYNNEDCILAWFFDENGIQRETVVSEATATETTNPVFIINHAIPKIKMDKIGEFYEKAKGGGAIPKTSTYFESNKIKIKAGYRYESGLSQPKSEFCIAGAIVRYNSPPVNFLHLTNNNDQSLKIKEVTKSQVDASSLINVVSHHAENMTPYSENKVFWNTFERDWNRPVQLFGNGNIFSQDWYVSGRARYANDWYQWIPNTVNIHATPFDWFGWESVVTFESWKSSYNLVKIN